MIITSNNIYLAYKFLRGFIQWNTRSAFSRNSEKTCDYSAPYQAMPAKTTSMSSFKISIHCMQNFVRFRAIESETELSQQFCKKRNSSSPYKDICTLIASLLFLTIYILYINFCVILITRNLDKHIPIILKKCDYRATC